MQSSSKVPAPEATSVSKGALREAHPSRHDGSSSKERGDFLSDCRQDEDPCRRARTCAAENCEMEPAAVAAHVPCAVEEDTPR